MRVRRPIRETCLHIPDTKPAHKLDGYNGRGTLVVNPLPDKAPTPTLPPRVKQPPTPPTSAPPPADLVLPPLPEHGISDEPAKGTARASGHYGCTYYPGTQGWSGPYWTRAYGVWYYVALEDCRVAGYWLGLRGGVAQNLQWIETIFFWNGYQPQYWYEFHNPEYSGTGGEVGACFAGSCNGF